MSDIKFLALLPQPAYRAKKIRIRGRMGQNAEQFSINFVNETTCYNPQNITYHFKEIVNTYPQILIENYKRDGEWVDHQQRELEAFDGPFELLLTSTAFALEFSFDFDEDTIRVYSIQEDGYNFLTSYETSFPLTDILAVQVWGDVEKVAEFSLLYD